jgi:signal transduction histidine kinase
VSEVTELTSGRPGGRQTLPPHVRFVAAVTLVLALTLVIFFGIARPPVSDLVALAGMLSVAAVVAVALGYGAFTFGLVDRSPTIRWILMGGYAIANILAFVSVWMTAALMFVNQHDLALATVLLLFAGGIALSLGYVLSASITGRISDLSRAARHIARGDLSTRVHVTGQDELAELAGAFNSMAAQLERAEEDRQELDALRREMVAWVGHDLRTPLTSIRVVVEALADGVVDDPETEERYLRTARQHIHSLSQLLDDLFDVVQMDTRSIVLDSQPACIADLISDTLESFSALASRAEVRLVGNTEPHMDALPMDVRKVGRVLDNLVLNAIENTPPGGKVRVKAAGMDSGVLVEVEDDGEGIDDEVLPHVFERFRRREGSRPRDSQKAGLGLVIAKGIVEAHGGEIGVESVVGEGTRVWFSLPGSHPS